jgi:uncharacterized membrane protein YebE (DUF533 family)
MLGTLAYKAYQSYQQARPEPQAQTPIAATPRRAAAPAASAADELSETDAQILIRAMVAAANADGHVDADEAARIRRKLQQSGAGDDELRFVAQEIRAPASVDVLVREARDPEMASHIYAASLLGMGEYTRANQTYLAYLATRLRLDPATIAQLHRQLGVPPLPAS